MKYNVVCTVVKDLIMFSNSKNMFRYNMLNRGTQFVIVKRFLQITVRHRLVCAFGAEDNSKAQVTFLN